MAALIHALGLSLLHRVRFRPANQRLLIIHLAWAELCTSLSQALVYTFFANGRWNPYSTCSFMDKFVYRLFGGTSKLIMIYLICDKAFDIYFHMRYPLYFTQQTVEKVMIVLWSIGFSHALTTVLMEKFKVQAYIVILYTFRLGTDALIVITASITYSYLFFKVRQIRANSRVHV